MTDELAHELSGVCLCPLSPATPNFAAQAFLAHLTPGSGRQEHPCPRKFDNEVTMAEIDHQEEMIRDIHEARVGTKESYKVPEGGQGFGRRQVEGEDGICLVCWCMLKVRPE